jgi:hypothetical protein
MNVVVSGYYAGFPVAGLFWHAVSFALGFTELGHQVWYLEDSGDVPWGFDFERLDFDHDCHYGVRRLAAEMDAVAMGDRWVYRHVPTDRWDGLGRDRAMDVLAGADVLVNISLSAPMRPEYLHIPHRLAVDTDPVFNQVRMRTSTTPAATVADTHTRLFTFGRPPLPAQRPGDEWLPIRQPVVSRLWPVAGPPEPNAPFTTVTHWEAYPGISWDGAYYGTKGDTMREYADLPHRTGVPLALALGGSARAQRTMTEGGWRVREPVGVSETTADYRAWIAASAGEIGFAKHGYVTARSGWFSDRTCCYLASGRPAVVQDTGWSEWLPAGEGVLAFSDPAHAAAALEQVTADPGRHARAARKLVEEHFEAGRVCAAMLEAL